MLFRGRGRSRRGVLLEGVIDSYRLERIERGEDEGPGL